MTSRPVQAILFDCDGVLLESAAIKTQAFGQLFQEISPQQIPEIIQYHIANQGISRFVKFRYIFKNILHRPLEEKEEVALGNRYGELVREKLLAASFVSGLENFLEMESKKQRYHLFVASGTPEDELCDIARARGLFSYFREWHGAPKTKPAIIKDILTRYNLKPNQIVFIGDSLNDWEAAKKMRIPFIGRCALNESPFPGEVRTVQNLFEFSNILDDLECEVKTL